MTYVTHLNALRIKSSKRQRYGSIKNLICFVKLFSKFAYMNSQKNDGLSVITQKITQNFLK